MSKFKIMTTSKTFVIEAASFTDALDQVMPRVRRGNNVHTMMRGTARLIMNVQTAKGNIVDAIEIERIA